MTILVLPPSFPFGGMENPQLTFATPAIIAGDRSLVGHGDPSILLVGQSNEPMPHGSDFYWLNEGFTVYFENWIMEAVCGPDRAMQEEVLGWQEPAVSDRRPARPTPSSAGPRRARSRWHDRHRL
jgi:hypothetical protein